MNSLIFEKVDKQKMKSTNELFPIFLKLRNFHTLLLGAGNVGLEKLTALVGNDPLANVLVVSAEVSPEFQSFASDYPHVHIEKRLFEESDLDGVSLIILATDSRSLHEYIYELAKERGILLNVADTPDLCDLYLGSIVKKGNLKVGISTNGKSPTFAKRLKEVLNEALPNEVDETLDRLNAVRDSLKGDFSYKVKKLNEITAGLVEKPKTLTIPLLTFRLMIGSVILLVLIIFAILL